MTKQDYFFRSLFSLWGFVLARTKPHRLKPVPLIPFVGFGLSFARSTENSTGEHVESPG